MNAKVPNFLLECVGYSNNRIVNEYIIVERPEILFFINLSITHVIPLNQAVGSSH